MDLSIIVGTGRCGSTLLSRILHRHPDVLSMSEFFGSLWMMPEDLPAGPLSGRQFWDQMSAPQPFLDDVIRSGFAIPEFRYPYGSGRFSPASGVPRISHMTLPALTGDPDALFDQMAAEVPGWPIRPPGAQVRALMEFLAGLLGRRVAVERTAGSLSLLPLLVTLFPEARFVHMYRDGPDCALSMSRHLGARVLGLAEMARQSPGADTELAALLTPPLDAAKIMTYPAPSPVVFGRLWSRMVTGGLASLRRLPQGSWTTLRYEDLLREPDAELTALAGFIGVRPEPNWLAAARRMLDPGRPGQAVRRLDPGQLTALRAACDPGLQAIQATPAPGRAARMRSTSPLWQTADPKALGLSEERVRARMWYLEPGAPSCPSRARA